MSRAKILSAIGWFVLSLWSRFIRIRFVNREVPDKLVQSGTNVIYAFWHGRQFLLFRCYQGTGVVIPASESRDGDIQAGILKRFGFEVVRGSSKRKGDRALLGLVDALRSGKNIALAIDGPRGPRYEAKQGVLYLAGKLNKPIVPVVTSAHRYWVLKKVWDQYLLPKPFTRGVVMYGEPVYVHGVEETELQTKRRELEASLNELMARADAYFTDHRS